MCAPDLIECLLVTAKGDKYMFEDGNLFTSLMFIAPNGFMITLIRPWPSSMMQVFRIVSAGTYIFLEDIIS